MFKQKKMRSPLRLRIFFVFILYQVNNRDASTTKLGMLVMIIGNGRNCSKILTNERSKDAIACSVQDADACGRGDKCVIHKIGDGLKCFVSTHSTHIDFCFEMK